MCGEGLNPAAAPSVLTGGVPVIINPRRPGKRGIISSPMWPPSDHPNTTASAMPSWLSASTSASAKPGIV